MLGRQNYRHPLSLWNREGLFIKVTVRHGTVILVAGPTRRTIAGISWGIVEVTMVRIAFPRGGTL